MCVSLPASVNTFIPLFSSAASLGSPVFYTTNLETCFDGEIEPQIWIEALGSKIRVQLSHTK